MLSDVWRPPLALGYARVSRWIVIAIALLAYSCAFTGAQPTASEALTVSKLNGSKDVYVGKKISVEGEVYVLTLSGLHACDPAQRCPKYDDALLTLVDLQRDSVLRQEQMIRLYRRSTSTDRPEPIHCKIVDENTPAFDCGQFVRGAVTTVHGVFTKERVPDQVVGDSTGHIQVLKYRDTYFVLID
jgi:hypothetical protein